MAHKLGEKAGKCQRRQETEILLSGYVPIKMGVHPAVSTAANIKNIKRQINDIAAIYDWDMEVNTTDPDFYKWTQWIFVKMFKEGLAYEKEFPINWCPSCKTGLANEEVVNGCCERCGTPVTKICRQTFK